jgi:hypothetical protein
LFVLDQPPHERIARVSLLFHARQRFRTWQEHFRLDVNQSRRHHQEFARDVEIQLLHHVNCLQVLRSNQRDGNVVDIDVVLFDEVQQQIERPLEVIELDGKGFGRRFELGLAQGHYERCMCTAEDTDEDPEGKPCAILPPRRLRRPWFYL